MDQGRTEILRGVDRCAQRVFDHLAVGRAERRGHRVEVGQIDGNAGEDSTVFGLLFLVEVERIAVCQREVFFHGSKLQLDGSQAEILQPVCVFTLSRFVTGKRDGEEAALMTNLGLSNKSVWFHFSAMVLFLRRTK